MAKPLPIIASIDANEAHRLRAERLRRALQVDGHFLLGKIENLSHDIRFQWMGQTLNVELKDFTGDHQSDYVAYGRPGIPESVAWNYSASEDAKSRAKMGG